MDRVKIYNGKLITPSRIIKDGTIVIENGKIVYVGRNNFEADDCISIDAHGDYVSPGFIDIHTHGGGGHDFMDGTVDAFLLAAEKHAQFGTTAMLPTTLTCTDDELWNTFEVFRQAKNANEKGAKLLGLHLEGPYFSLEQKGAQDARYIKNPMFKEYSDILERSGDIIRWSAAPELNGALEFGRYIKQRGVLPSIAHTNATSDEIEEAYENGFTHVTHLYSGMPGIRRINAYRFAGAVESAFLIDDMTVEIIADGAHLPASLLKLVYKLKGPSHTALVTDSMRAAGQGEGESILGSIKNGVRVIIEDGVAKPLDRTAFAGSVATADRLVRTMISLACIPISDAVRMMTSTPAEIIGQNANIGSLTVGKDADIIIFDDNINIFATFIKGKNVYYSKTFNNS